MEPQVTNNQPVQPEVKINHFYIAKLNDSQACLSFAVDKGTIVNSYTFEFRLGILRRNVTGNLTLKLDMGDDNYFAILPLEGDQIRLNDGWLGTEYLVQNTITDVRPNQTGHYFAHVLLDEVEIAKAETTLFIVEAN